jgi:hypothetical protein
VLPSRLLPLAQPLPGAPCPTAAALTLLLLILIVCIRLHTINAEVTVQRAAVMLI